MVQASAKKLEHNGPAEKKRVASVPHRNQLARPEPLLPKKRNRAVSPEYQIMRARAAPWRERGGDQREHGEERVDSLVNEGRFQKGKGGQARRASLREVEGSMSG